MCSCKNCYWNNRRYRGQWCELRGVKPDNSICNNFKYECSCGGEAEYEYENKFYCKHCLFGKFNVRSKTITYYQSKEGRELGTNKDIDEVIYKLDKNIKHV